jgi:hypothetical protein
MCSFSHYSWLVTWLLFKTDKINYGRNSLKIHTNNYGTSSFKIDTNYYGRNFTKKIHFLQFQKPCGIKWHNLSVVWSITNTSFAGEYVSGTYESKQGVQFDI